LTKHRKLLEEEFSVQGQRMSCKFIGAFRRAIYLPLEPERGWPLLAADKPAEAD
jgi:hypothetical protein